MKAVVLYEHGGLDRLRYVDFPEPVPSTNEVVIRVKSCGVNHSLDLRVRQDGAGRKITFPHVLGADISGEIAGLGPGVKEFRIGEPVVIMPWVTCGKCTYCQNEQENSCSAAKCIGVHLPGGYAEYVKAPVANVVRLPKSINYEQAAAVPVAFGTAWHLLVSRGRLNSKDTVLVLAAAGGVGIAATQIAKLHGARVLAAVGSDEKVDRMRAIGADWAVNYSVSNLSEEVERVTDGAGVDVVLETVGAPTWDTSVRLLRPEGRLLCCGSTGGKRVEIDLRFLYRRNISFFFSHGGVRRDIRGIIQLISDGMLTPVVHCVYALKEAPYAHELLEQRRNIGKVVLNP